MRRLFTRALTPELVEGHAQDLRGIVKGHLNAMACSPPDLAADPKRLVQTLEMIAMDMLFHVLYGVTPGDAEFLQLHDAYQRLGPDGFEWNLGQAQETAMADLFVIVESLIENIRAAPRSGRRSVLEDLVAAHEDGPVPAAVTGNLIYMIEMGGFDLTSLMLWTLKYLSDFPLVIDEIRSEGRPVVPGTSAIARATILETLRLEQSEVVVRRVIDDIQFEGWMIPKGSYLRACMRDAHRDPAVFPDPATFEPRRFLDRRFSSDEYETFGFDHHRCLAGDLVVRLGSIFIEELVNGFSWEVLADGPRQRGRYHWIPSPSFDVQIAENVAQKA